MSTSLMTSEEMSAMMRGGEGTLLDIMRISRDKWVRQLAFIEERFPEKVESADIREWILRLPLGSVSCALCERYYRYYAEEHCYDCPINEGCQTAWGEFQRYMLAYIWNAPKPFPLTDDDNRADVTVNDLLELGRRVLELIEDAIQEAKKP